MVELSDMSVRALAHAYRDGSATPVEAARSCFDRIDDHAAADAYCWLDADRALTWAREAEERFRTDRARGPLDGIPVAIKDVLHVTGWPTRRGSHTTPRSPAEFNSPAVDRILEAGAVPVGKTTTSELGWKATTDSPLTGPTRNPRAHDLTAGGSSGGSASVVALSTVPVALGTDAGGSVRIPASFCGVVGAIATYGRVPLWPAPPLSTLVRIGPLCRSVADAAIVLSCISGPDPRVPSTGFRPIAAAGPGPAEVRRVGILREVVGQRPSAAVAARLDAVISVLEAAGYETRDLTLGTSSDVGTFETLWACGHAYFVDAIGNRSSSRTMDPGLLALAERGRAVTAVGYLRAEAGKADLQRAADELFTSVDVLLSPTVGIEPFPIGSDVPPGWHSPHWWTWAGFTLAFNLTGNPAVSLPVPSGDDLPLGVQLIGRHGTDEDLLRFAAAVESLLAM